MKINTIFILFVLGILFTSCHKKTTYLIKEVNISNHNTEGFNANYNDTLSTYLKSNLTGHKIEFSTVKDTIIVGNLFKSKVVKLGLVSNDKLSYKGEVVGAHSTAYIVYNSENRLLIISLVAMDRDVKLFRPAQFGEFILKGAKLNYGRVVCRLSKVD